MDNPLPFWFHRPGSQHCGRPLLPGGTDTVSPSHRPPLTNMSSRTIATITAVLVVNVDTNPVWLAWILPTLIITPVIVWWNFRVVRRGAIRSP